MGFSRFKVMPSITVFFIFTLLLQIVLAQFPAPPAPPTLPNPPTSPTPPIPPSLPVLPPGIGEYAPFGPVGIVPPGWTELPDVVSEEILTIKIGLTLVGLDQIEKFVLDGVQGTQEDLAKIYPPQTVVDLISSWLKVFGITVEYSAGWISFDVKVATLETLFRATYKKYKSEATGKIIIRALGISIPDLIAKTIDVVYPTADFDEDIQGAAPVSIMLSKRQNDCNQGITPRCLQQLYGIPTQPATQQNNVLAVPGFLNEYASKTDLAKFQKSFRPEMTAAPDFKVSSVDNGQNDESKPGLEASLDIQYTAGIATGVPIIFHSSGLASITGFINLFEDYRKMPNVSVVTLSYGFDEYQVQPALAKRLCNEFITLAYKGVSVLIASGDGGVAGSRPKASCYNSRFMPTFPASCPFVTSVGATQGMVETGAALSAGGFSNIFDRPPYQNLAVPAYLSKLGNQYAGLYNQNGRAFPDIAAAGKNIVIVRNGEYLKVDGTSASAPIVASMVALLNDQRLAAGKKRLGFLNRYIYSNPELVKDITAGNNPSCSTPGFSAAPGWDPVTGAGTPIFSRWLNLP